MTKLTHGPLVGATTDREVSIWLRGDGEGEVMIRLSKTMDAVNDAAAKSKKAWLKSRQDYTAVLSFTDLEADTTYHYAVLIDGEAVLGPEFDGMTTLRTFPGSGKKADSFSFAFGSCFIPEVHSDKIFKNLVGERDFDPRFFLMIGDNVYVDEYLKLHNREEGLPTESLLELYRAAYRKSWSYPIFRQALAQTPSFMIFDDHEFWNNWNNLTVHQLDEEGLPAAKQSYLEYQDSHNPYAKARHVSVEPTYYYTFSYGKDIGFFVLDGRMRRNPDAVPYRTILGDQQRQALYRWLKDNKDEYRLKFIVSSVPISFVALPHVIVQAFHGTLGDQWLGYPQERLDLFKFIDHEDIKGVHFLSGDIHLGQGLVIKSITDDPGPTAYSYTSSPLANNFHLLPEEVPSWASTLLWVVLGLIVGVVAALLLDFSFIWGLVGGLVGGFVASWLWRRYKRGQEPEVKKGMGWIEKGLYMILREIAHKAYLRRNMGVAADTIAGGGVHYVPDNLFKPVHDYNMGIVTVQRQDDGSLLVQFRLVDPDGKICACEEDPHQV